MGRYAEYSVRLAFTLYNFDVYTAEVDDRGIDFVIRKDPARHYDDQVKSVRKANYVFFPKHVFDLRENLFAAVVRFTDGRPPDPYLIPSTAWRSPDALLVSRNLEGRRSRPQWERNLPKGNGRLLARFAFDSIVQEL